ncbi:hypothetical protein BJ138DRAFT_1163910 [Hygrophoropsis aurantiaca]|uniref:Uncharacterized protein n=1 Tax=Hygrophoropsis aurantiaca TaxID=72124 RepID=A0ACB7ZXW7_9AGAM|nr:hypothetical protein BJ138DRAFT_1163910 [Hygrophoropsis aurantiaca]
MTTTIDVKTSNHLNAISLESIDLSVHFVGNISLRTVPEHIPIFVSIQLGDEWKDNFQPVVVSKPMSTNNMLSNSLPAEMFPFLPLPSQFDIHNDIEWESLAKEIEYHLLQEPTLDVVHPGCYALMREFFWMAFVSAFTSFPYGQWPFWDARIPLDGEFISGWMADLDERGSAHTPATVRESTWNLLKGAVEELLLIPIKRDS